MLRIVDIKIKSDDILKEITKEISQLHKLNKNVEKNKKVIQKIISSTQFKLNEYEYIQNLKSKDKKNQIKSKKNQKIIQRKLKIKGKKHSKQSKSFLKWLINNKEL